MTDKLLMAVCLGCLGAATGYALCIRLKRRAEYFADLDDFLRVFSESLVCSLDTVPRVIGDYEARSPLLAKQLGECREAIVSGGPPELSRGSLTEREAALVREVLCGLGSRSAESERAAAENYRRKIGEYGKLAADKYAKLGRSAVKLGFLAGLLAAVLCW